jgi:hypothetical protein
MKLLAASALLFASLSMQAGETWIRIDADGWAEKLTTAPVSLAPGEHAWHWSADCGPKRVTSLPDADCVALESRRISLIAPPPLREPGAGQRVLWGTRAMLAEIPDALLPSTELLNLKAVDLRVPPGADVVARATGPLASRWIPLRGGTTTMRLVPGIAVSLEARSSGVPARHAQVEITAADDPASRAIPFRGAGDGRIALPPIPSNDFIRLLVWSEDGLPSITTARASAVPHRVELARGFSVSGEVLGPDDHPIPAVHLSAQFVVPKEDVHITRRAASDGKGRFRLTGIGPGRVLWRGEKDAFAPRSGVLAVMTDVDGFRVRFDHGRIVQFLVRSGKTVIQKATITAPNGQKAETDARGMAQLAAVSEEPFTAVVRRDGYLREDVPVSIKTDKPIVVDLKRAAAIRAQVVRASDGSAAGPGSVEVSFDGVTDIVPFGADGVIEIGQMAASRVALEIRADGLSPFRVPARDVSAGEAVDLGTIRLTTGMSLRGSVTAAENETPLAGATVRVLRTNSFSPLLAVVRRDWIETQSDDTGAFLLQGVLPGPWVVMASAPGRAPMVRTGSGDDTTPVDLGALPLEQGRTIHVTCEPVARCGTEASIVLANADWMTLSAPLSEGRATIGPVAAGSATLRLTNSAAVVHEEKVEVRQTETTEVDVHLHGVDVTGSVIRGREPVRSGSVAFLSGTTTGKLITIARSSASGAYGADNYGVTPERRSAQVLQDGSFHIDDVAPGDYLLSWSDGAVQSPQRQVHVASGNAQQVIVELAPSSVEGTVRLAAGGAPPFAAVTATQQGHEARVMTASDGTFRIVGLDPGPVKLHAAAFDPQAQTEKTIELRDGETASVQLILEGNEEERTFVLTSAGAPLANAFVFVHGGAAMRVATTGADGRASIQVPSNEANAELAVFSPMVGWAFWPARNLTGTTALDVAPARSALIIRAEASLPVGLWSTSGFPVHEALANLGVRLSTSATSPLRIDHLPRGSYVVSAGSERRTVMLADLSEIPF